MIDGQTWVIIRGATIWTHVNPKTPGLVENIDKWIREQHFGTLLYTPEMGWHL